MLFKTYKLTAVPTTYGPDELYFISGTGANEMEMYLSNSAGTALRRLPTIADINALITAAQASANSIEIAQDIPERNGYTFTKNTTVLVLDASADPTVASGAATYIWNNTTGAYNKIAEHESQDLALTWAALTGGPTSTPVNIDDAVSKRHEHSNLTQLELIGQDANGDMTYNGELPKTAWESTDW